MFPAGNRKERKKRIGLEQGFTLIELLITIVILGILLAIALPNFLGSSDSARDRKAEAELRSALSLLQAEYLTAGRSYTQGPLAVGATAKERADAFAQATLQMNGLEAVVSETPEAGKIGVWMNSDGKGGKMFVLLSSGYRQVSLGEEMLSLPDVTISGASSDTTRNIDGQNWRIVIWRDSGSIDISSGTLNVEYLVVAGGGGGGSRYTAGGGGAGGLLTNVGQTELSLSGQQTITVGRGGSGGSALSANQQGENGGNSSIESSVVAFGGGGGGGVRDAQGEMGGSGGGGSQGRLTRVNPGGAGTAGQGYRGGSGWGHQDNAPARSGGGGGGAGGVGEDSLPSSSQGGAGGPGLASIISGEEIFYAGGGGGGAKTSGGLGGGGDSGLINSPGLNATDGSGGGGGGSAGYSVAYKGGDGGDGIVILRWRI